MWPFDRLTKEQRYNQQYGEHPSPEEVIIDQRERKEDLKYDKKIDTAVKTFLKRTDEDTKRDIYHHSNINKCLKDDFEHLGHPDDC